MIIRHLFKCFRYPTQCLHIIPNLYAFSNKEHPQVDEQGRKIIQVSQQEYLKMKKLMQSQPKQQQQQQQQEQQQYGKFFTSQQQVLSFKLMQLEQPQQYASIFKQHKDSSLTNKFIILFRYLTIGGQLHDEISKQYTSYVYENITSLQQSQLIQFLTYIHNHHKDNDKPNPVPLINNPSHTNINIIVLLMNLYPSQFNTIISHYYLEQGIYNCRQICYILKHNPKQQHIPKNILKSSLAQATFQELVQCVNYCIQTSQLDKLTQVRQIFDDKFLVKCSQSDLLQLLYNAVTHKQLQYIHNIVQAIKNKITAQQTSKMVLNSKDYCNIWKSAIALCHYHHQRYQQHNIIQLVQYALPSGLQLIYEQIDVQQVFDVLVAYAKILPFHIPQHELLPKYGKYNSCMLQFKNRSVLKTMFRDLRHRLQGNKVIIATILSTQYECQQSYMCPQVISKLGQLSQKQENQRFRPFINKIMVKFTK